MSVIGLPWGGSEAVCAVDPRPCERKDWRLQGGLVVVAPAADAVLAGPPTSPSAVCSHAGAAATTDLISGTSHHLLRLDDVSERFLLVPQRRKMLLLL